MKKILLSIAFALASTGSVAQEIYAPLPFKNTGTAAPALIVLSEELNKRGWDVDFKAVGSCGPVKEAFESSDKTVLTLWNDLWNAKTDNTCYMPITQNNFLDVVRTTWKFLCGPKGQPNFNLETGKTYKLGTTSYGIDFTKKMLDTLAKKKGIEFKYIPYESSGKLRKSYEAGEFDLIYNFSGRKYFNEDQTACFYNNSDNAIDGIPSIFTEIDLILPLDVYNLYAVTNGKGLTDSQLSKLKSDVRDIVENNPTLNENLKKTYSDRYVGTPEQQFKFVTGQ